jgi:hypothetical protein
MQNSGFVNPKFLFRYELKFPCWFQTKKSIFFGKFELKNELICSNAFCLVEVMFFISSSEIPF